jgi:hypothetical protein
MNKSLDSNEEDGRFYAYIFFGSGLSDMRKRRLGWWRKARITCRYPLRSFIFLLAKFTKLISNSRIVHCAVSDGQAVLDTTVRGDWYWPFLLYILKYPGLTCLIRVSLVRPLDIDDYEVGIPKKIFPTMLRWLSRGMVDANDCASTVTKCLREAGIDIPRYIVKPVELHDYLLRKGYKHVHMAGTVATQDNRSCCGP